MNRRRILKLLSLGPLGLLIPNNSLLAGLTGSSLRKAIPIGPIDAITAGLDIGKLFAGMFGGQDAGPSYADFFQNLNGQINDLNAKLNFILQNENEIRALIQNLPVDVVAKLKQVDILGSLTLYQGILEGLAAPKTYNGNLAKFMADGQNRQTVSNVADAIRTSKAGLMNTANDPYYVPYVAIAVHVEYNLRSNFLAQPWKEYVGQMKIDKEWLDRFVWQGDTTLEKLISSLKQDRESLSTKLITKSNKYVIGLCKEGQYSGGYNYFPIQVNYSVDGDLLKGENPSIKTLRAIGLLGERDKPLKLSIPSPDDPSIENKVTAPGLDQQVDFVGNGNYFQQLQDFKAFRQTLADNQTKNELALNYSTLIATCSSYYCGLKAIEYCNINLKVANMIR